MSAGNGLALDLLSTKQKMFCADAFFCSRGAPFFAMKTSEKGYSVAQGCCNHWECPRCGVMRAKTEYGRMVEGALTLEAQHGLRFFTITSRGSDISLEDAQASYYTYTNRLLSSLRANAKKRGQPWHYAQVTERQRRGHPHSHILMTYNPGDLRAGVVEKWKTGPNGRFVEYVDALRSEYLEKRVVSAGLGSQYDISEVQSAAAASRYVAKYLFKSAMFTTWPKGWKRVRYSRSWPKLQREKSSDTFVLLDSRDWQRLSRVALVVSPVDVAAHMECEIRLKNADVFIRKPKGNEENHD